MASNENLATGMRGFGVRPPENLQLTTSPLALAVGLDDIQTREEMTVHSEQNCTYLDRLRK